MGLSYTPVLIINKPFKGEPLLAGFPSTATHYNSFYTVREKPNIRGSAGWIQDVWSYNCKYNLSQTKSSVVIHSDIGPPLGLNPIQPLSWPCPQIASDGAWYFFQKDFRFGEIGSFARLCMHLTSFSPNISCQWSGSGPMVQHYCHGITIYIHPNVKRKRKFTYIRSLF